MIPFFFLLFVWGIGERWRLFDDRVGEVERVICATMYSERGYEGVRGRSSRVESGWIWLLDLHSFVGEGGSGLDSLGFFF